MDARASSASACGRPWCKQKEREGRKRKEGEGSKEGGERKDRKGERMKREEREKRGRGNMLHGSSGMDASVFDTITDTVTDYNSNTLQVLSGAHSRSF